MACGVVKRDSCVIITVGRDVPVRLLKSGGDKMDYKRILTIQDISCIGQCSLTVALPILSACGHETAILPSAILSTHTGGFTGYTFRDLTDDMPAISAHWQKEGLKFDAFYTGYLGSSRQAAIIMDIFDTCGKDGSVKVVDPAMADLGKLYPGFDDEFVKTMATLCEKADYILPNITEACLMTGVEYKEDYDEAYIDSLLDALVSIGCRNIVLTGVGFAEGETGVMVYENGEKKHYAHKKISKGCHGTGDVFASAFTGAMLRGLSAYDAAKIAADYTVKCIQNTIDDPDHWYGVKFETCLAELGMMLNK